MPEAGIIRPHLAGRIDHQLGRRPGVTIVVTGDRNDIIAGPFAWLIGPTGIPHRPEPPTGGPLDARNPLKDPRAIGIFRSGLCLDRRRHQGRIVGLHSAEAKDDGKFSELHDHDTV